MRGFLAQANNHAAFEPDVVIRCGPTNPRSRAATDPVVVFEVLSPSTMRYDRGTKLERYREIASLKQIVLVYQDSIWTSLRGVEGSVKNPSTPGERNGTQTTPETVYAGV